jgi:hypothetical protein
MKNSEIRFGFRSLAKILLLTLFLSGSLKALSQKDSVTVNDSVVRISKSVAQKILIAADSIPILNKQTASLKSDIINYKNLVSVKDDQIKAKYDSIRLLSGIRVTQDRQKELLLSQVQAEHKKLKWSKTKTTVSQLLLLAVTGILITKL